MEIHVDRGTSFRFPSGEFLELKSKQQILFSVPRSKRPNVKKVEAVFETWHVGVTKTVYITPGVKVDGGTLKRCFSRATIYNIIYVYIHIYVVHVYIYITCHKIPLQVKDLLKTEVKDHALLLKT